METETCKKEGKKKNTGYEKIFCRDMKAVFLTGIQEIEIRETQMPVAKRGEVLIKVMTVGICGSDVHYYKRGRIGSQIVKYPFIVGHECSGIVESITEGVRNVSVGERVAIEPAIPCGLCEFCCSARPNICPKVKFLGTPATSGAPPVEGALREYITMPASNVIPIPQALSFEEATLTEIVAIAIHAVDLVGINPGDEVAIFGSGPIGLATLQASKVSGAARIFATDLLNSRLQMAKVLGADYVANLKEVDPMDMIKDITRGRGVDVTFEAAGEQETVNHALEAVRRGGRTAIIGIPEEERIWYNPEIRRKELVIYHVRRSNQANRDVERAISLMAGGKLEVDSLVTHEFPLEKTGDALDLVGNYEDGVIKAMIKLDK
ncbi:MAG TPA: NAD(P)-dependent alcohol dehydrogenase [Candidatus Omnitrophica bacterium]|nr:NAD(P)-dependent alcohol dehydrogenase [Candidatus Omnitrophota bacterium]